MRLATCVVVVGLGGTALAQRADYQGPTILSRGVGPALRSGGELVRIRPYVRVNGIYDTGLTPVSVDENGNIPEVDVYGVQGSAGVIGYHSWRRTVLGVDYRGNYRHYTNGSYYDGTDQILTLGVTHQPSRRVALSFREAAGTYSRDFGPLNAAGFYDPNFSDVPANELFDGRVYYASSMADLTYSKSNRLSFNIGGGGTMVRRRSRSLIGVTAATARGDMAYRLNEATAIGADYFYNHYGFTSAFGSSDVHGAAFNYAVRLGRYWHFGLRAGAARVETLGLRRVAIDPVVAAIIGQTVGVETFHRVNYIPTGDARLTRSFRRSSLSFGYSTGTNYGNGVFLTSRIQSAFADYSYTGMRRWNFGLSAGYYDYSSLSQTIGKYYNYHAGVGTTYKLKDWFHLVTRFDVRHYEVRNNPLKRLGYRATLGFAVTPGELPLSLW